MWPTVVSVRQTDLGSWCLASQADIASPCHNVRGRVNWLASEGASKGKAKKTAPLLCQTAVSIMWPLLTMWIRKRSTKPSVEHAYDLVVARPAKHIAREHACFMDSEATVAVELVEARAARSTGSARHRLLRYQ